MIARSFLASAPRRSRGFPSLSGPFAFAFLLLSSTAVAACSGDDSPASPASPSSAGSSGSAGRAAGDGGGHGDGGGRAGNGGEAGTGTGKGDAAASCPSFAEAVCKRRLACRPSPPDGAERMGFRDEAECAIAYGRLCQWAVALPGSGFTADVVNGCGQAHQAAACTTVFDLLDTPVCAGLGTGKPGSPCEAGIQCANGVCGDALTSASFGQPGHCSTCSAATKIAQEGESCGLSAPNSACAGGLGCLGDTCKRPSGGVEVCADGKACFSPQSCVGGVCGQAEVACAFHGDCRSGNCLCTTFPCFDGGDPSGTCGPTQVSAAGETCTFGWPPQNEIWRPCAAGLRCEGFPGNTCVPIGDVGAACEDTDGCRFPLMCVNDTCAAPSPTRCSK